MTSPSTSVDDRGILLSVGDGSAGTQDGAAQADRIPDLQSPTSFDEEAARFRDNWDAFEILNSAAVDLVFDERFPGDPKMHNAFVLLTRAARRAVDLEELYF